VAEVVMRPKELLMRKVTPMAEGHKRSKVTGTKAVMKAAKTAKSSREMASSKVTSPPMETAYMASSAEPAEPVSPGLYSKKHGESKNDACNNSFFHRSPS
jgi:hypothetical protein